MKSQDRASFLGECAALALPFIAALVELVIRNGYHQISAEPTRFVYLAAIAGVSLLITCLTMIGRPRAPWLQILRAGNRLLGLLTWAWIVAIRGAAISDWSSEAALATLSVTLVGIAAMAWCVFGEARWHRMRPTLLLSGTLFVVSQPVLGRMMSPDLAWPGAAAVGSAAAPDDNVLVVLLDELNAREGPALADVLRSHGMSVTQKAIDAVADSTAKVIPEIWSGARFTSPKPCSFTAICSEGVALDFAKVYASRPDIDVVGFYHPYCAMRGLRWCERIGLPLPFDKVSRWACSMRSRLNLQDTGHCMASQNEPFLELRGAALAAIWQAPFWRQGGMLFAHLPLPHPPGARSGGALREDYRDNLALAAELLGQMANRAHAAGLKHLRLAVFSDHPLRQRLWCAKPVYQVRGCKQDAELVDRQVPLIVATFGDDPIDLSGIRTNAQVFDLAVTTAR